MNNTHLLTKTDEHLLITQLDDATAAVQSTINKFVEHQDLCGYPWYSPNLAAWRDSLIINGVSPASVNVYLSRIRGAYKRLMDDQRTHDYLLNVLTHDPVDGHQLTTAERQILIDTVMGRIGRSIKVKWVPEPKKQDVVDSEHIRLTPAQVEQLLHTAAHQNNDNDLMSVRDTALLALVVCTGIRRGECVALDVDDLRQELDGELSLWIREGKGNKTRAVPYGDNDWCLVLVDRWLELAGITEGAVFRGLGRWNGVEDVRLSERGVNRITERYSIIVGGRQITVEPHDLRRTYARVQYDAGMDLVAIQQNLGHEDIKITQGYIGTLDVKRRRSRGYNVNVEDLMTKRLM